MLVPVVYTTVVAKYSVVNVVVTTPLDDGVMVRTAVATRPTTVVETEGASVMVVVVSEMVYDVSVRTPLGSGDVY